MLRNTVKNEITKATPDNTAFAVLRPADEAHGDYATNAAFLLAKKEKKAPHSIAQELAGKIPSDLFEKIEAASNGFINFFLKKEVLYRELTDILTQKERYGDSDIGKNKKARVEYISANPTGPIHIGNARGGPLGETIARVLEKTGYQVLREYFHNNMGTQVEKLGQSLWYWYKKELGDKTVTLPEDGYKGEYLKEIAQSAIHELGNQLITESGVAALTEFALTYMYKENMETISRMGIRFDAITKESELIHSGKTETAVKHLQSLGVTKEQDGALWFNPKDEFLEDREAVIIRSTGQPTYFASDIAYHREKFESGYDLVIDIFGSGHYGHVPKLQALTKIFGFHPENFKTLLYQYVRVKRGDEIIKMSKRAGNYVTAKEVLDEVGKDAMNFFLLAYSPDSHIDFDLELAKEQSVKNPVYYIQYAHARIASILTYAGLNHELRITNYELLKEKEELTLIKKMAEFPEIIEDTAKDYQVHRLTRYALNLARTFHNFYEKHRVISDDKELTTSRLALIEGVRIIIGNALDVLGISKPEKM